MPNEVAHRTLSMRTAVSLTEFGRNNGGPGDLERLMRAFHTQFNTVPQRRMEINGQILEARNVNDADSSRPMLLHLVAYTPDDQVPVVPRVRDVRGAELELVDAPENTEFLDGQLMALVSRNDVLICRDGLGDSSLMSYVAMLVNRAGFNGPAMAFQLMKRPDIDKVEMIRREGIKSISMNTIANKASADHIERRHVRERLAGGLLDELKAILGLDDEVPEDAENLKVEIMFSFDKRDGTVLDQRQLAQLAERVLEEEDEGFSIETLHGRKVRAKDIVLSKPVKLPTFGKSVHHADAWEALGEFYEEISAVGS